VSPQPIIGAVDVFAQSPAAARCAGWLAEHSGAPLVLVHVVDPFDLPALPAIDPVTRRRLYERQEERACALAGERLLAVAAELPGADPSTMVLTGPVVATLHQLAADQQAALMVAGTAGREGLEHILHGSVAGELAAAAPCPVVVAPPEAQVRDTGPVLVGDDGSDGGRRALRHATAIAARLGCELVRMHVEEGDPVAALRDAANRQRAALLVTGTRGRGPVRAELFGSVSAGLVATAERPVALVSSRADEPAWAAG
jgi:nucleotide-binding universal stress UspA family protein